MSGLSTLVATISTEFKWQSGINLTGSVYNPIQNTGDIRKNQNLGTAAGNTASGGADELFSFQQGITAGNSATIDLTTMTDIMQRTNTAIVRIKGYQIRLLSAADDPTISPTPTATSTITVTNNGPTLPAALDFNTAGSGLTLNVTNSGGVINAVAIGTAGSGYIKSAHFIVSPNQASGSGAVISATTNSTGVPTSVAIVFGGAGYSDNTSLPSTVVGQYTVLTGGAHMYFDPNANGFCAVDSTHKNISIRNNDGSNAVTVEIDIIGCTS